MTVIAEPATEPQVTTPTIDCVFCERIARHEYDTCWNEVVSFEPLDPVVLGHRLFVPVTHVTNALTWPQLTGAVFAEAARWASEVGVDCNLITSAGAAATQTVWHLHVHYVPRTRDDSLALPWTERREWIVRDRTLTERRGNGVWASCRFLVGALILREKIYRSRYRGSRPWSWWRRVEHYVVPTRGSLVVMRRRVSDDA